MTDFDIFVTLADTGSFARTARMLDIPRSTVMRRVEALQAARGVQLVQRANRQVVLTAAGHQYATALRPLVRALHNVHADLLEHTGAPRGPLRVWLPFLGMSELFAAVFADFRAAYPEIQLVVELGRDVRRLELGSFDVALQAGTRLNRGLMAKNLMRERLVLVTTPGYAAANGLPETPADLMRHDVVQERTVEGKNIAWRTPDGERVPLPRPVMFANSPGLMYQLALQGVGIVRVAQTFAQRYFQSGGLVPVLPDHVWVEEHVNLIYMPEPSLKVRAFLDHMTANFRRHLGLV